MHKCNEVTLRYPQSHASTTSKYQFAERREKQYISFMVFECELAVKLHTKDVDAGTSVDGTPDETESPLGGFTFLHLLITIKTLVLVEFRIMHQWLSHSWILAMSLSREVSIAGMSAGLRITTSSVESSAKAYSLFSTSSNIWTNQFGVLLYFTSTLSCSNQFSQLGLMIRVRQSADSLKKDFKSYRYRFPIEYHLKTDCAKGIIFVTIPDCRGKQYFWMSPLFCSGTLITGGRIIQRFYMCVTFLQCVLDHWWTNC